MVDYGLPKTESPLCIACGWRQPEVPAEVQAEVEAYLGRPFVKDHYTHSQIGKGKPSLSGWEKEKRRREREKLRQQGRLHTG